MNGNREKKQRNRQNLKFTELQETDEKTKKQRQEFGEK